MEKYDVVLGTAKFLNLIQFGMNNTFPFSNRHLSQNMMHHFSTMNTLQ